MCVPYAGLPFGSPSGAGALALFGQTADERFRAILRREAVDVGPFSPVWAAKRTLDPCLNLWSQGFVEAVHPSGSFAKGTANRSGTDVDLFISIRNFVPNTLKEIHDTLFAQLHSRGFSPKRQNVSIGVVVDGISVDLVPGRQLGALSADHNLFHHKTGNWRKTNVLNHINLVRASGKADEIRLLKLWRDQRGLEFPSFYLELAVIRALADSPHYLLSSNVQRALRYFATVFVGHQFIDPANSNNKISDDLTHDGKVRIQQAAKSSLAMWPYVVR
jgi:hypothetical protein